MSRISREEVANNLAWKFMERCGAQGVTFLVSIILARLLDPEVYGIIALVTVFTALLQVFVDSGMGNALIQKKDADELDFSSVFYFNVASCVILYIGIFIAAPWIANFYNMPELTLIVRVIGLTIIISGVKNIQQAFVSKYMMFKRFFFATLGGTIGAAICGIWMAYAGYGVWALITQNLFNQIVDTIILWVTVKWKPRKLFSFTRLKILFSYGWKLLVASIIDTGYSKLRQLIIGKIYTVEDLAFYEKGQQFPSLIISNIGASIDSVLLSALSIEQENRERILAMSRRAIKTSTYILMPMMIGLSVCANPIVSLLLSDKWLPCVPFLRIACIATVIQTVSASSLIAIKAIGRSDLFLKLEIIKKILGFVVLFGTMWFGVRAIAYGLLIVSIVSQLINSWPNKKLLNYSYLDQLKDFLPSTVLSVVMGSIVYAVELLGVGNMKTLIIQIFVGSIVYVLISILFKFESFEYIIRIAKNYFNKSNT